MQKEDKEIFDTFFEARYYENSHFTFTNLFMWRKPYNMMWCVENGILFLKAQWETDEFALQPFGPQEKMQEAIAKWKAYFASKGRPLIFYGLEKSMADELEKFSGAEFNIIADEENFDYVYNSEDLINLKGRKFHSKKNHLNNFHKNYPDAKYISISDEVITLCKLTVNGWYKTRSQDLPDDPFIALEREAIIEVLNNFSQLSLKGGAVIDNNRIIAFTFGEALNTDTAVIHVEKADPDINGAYTFINQAFIMNEWADMKFINREEDMGIEGLRKAKQSYRPVKMIKKYNAEIKI
nr:phosphatidylglycerol lysyltransferase domain-containing protein [Pectinatus sottacetonis]